MNILSGLLRPNSGEVRAGDQRLEISSPRDAILNGIGMVHQHFMLVPALTVAENVALGDTRLPKWRVPVKGVAEKIAALSVEIGMPVDPNARVIDIGVGAR